LLPDQGSNLDFLESKSSVLPITPSGNSPKTAFPLQRTPFWEGKGRINLIKKNPNPEEIGSLEAFFLAGWLSAFHETVSPESVLVQYGNHRVFKVPVIVEINASVQRGCIALPNGSVLPAVEELDEQRTGLQVVFLLIVVQVLFLTLHPVFNVGLSISGKAKAVGKHLERNEQVGPVTYLSVAQKLHPANDRFLYDLIREAGVCLASRMHHFERTVALEIAAVTVVVLHRQLLVSHAGGKEESQEKQKGCSHGFQVSEINARQPIIHKTAETPV